MNTQQDKTRQNGDWISVTRTLLLERNLNLYEEVSDLAIRGHRRGE